MSEIPAEARCYFDSVKANDATTVAACFTQDAVVIDVGRRIEGRAAIQQWTENKVLGGVYEIEQVSPQQDGAQVLLRFKPKDSNGFRARYTFLFARGKIRSVDLEYA